MPLCDAVTGLLGVELPNGESRKGIPFVSYVCRKGEGGAVFIKALPLPEADIFLSWKMAAAGEVLYRVDYLLEGKPCCEIGILPEESGGTFLERLEAVIKRGDAEADKELFYGFLKLHLAFCGLEGLSEHELSFAERLGIGEGNGGYRKADAAYYKEVLSYAEKGREMLNSLPLAEAVGKLPSFPDKADFMRKWYLKEAEKREGGED